MRAGGSHDGVDAYDDDNADDDGNAQTSNRDCHAGGDDGSECEDDNDDDDDDDDDNDDDDYDDDDDRLHADAHAFDDGDGVCVMSIIMAAESSTARWQSSL